ncbi:MAG: hypothetical protein QNJ65_21605 [Xenococcaceae cyanobacterium MO_234.B1]|nr:hypothetical protein [Xenococcaceae cyanobacterium MO_234.B1]
MKIQWKKLWGKIIFWLGAEIVLTLIGLDDLADYSEFIGQQKEVASIEQAYPTLTVNFVNGYSH